jgi:hypothetical protein
MLIKLHYTCFKRFEVDVEEEVTEEFHNKTLPKMSTDFAEKMNITRWPPETRVRTLQGVNITVVRNDKNNDQ